MKQITLPEAEYIAHTLAKRLMDFDEPVPPFATRFPGRLESCLAQPFSTFDGKALYPTLPEKAALLFYLVIKNHPFENGNKRLAVTITLVFLDKNHKWVRVPAKDMYELACIVATSRPNEKDTVLERLTQIFGSLLIDSDE